MDHWLPVLRLLFWTALFLLGAWIAGHLALLIVADWIAAGML